MSKGKKQSNHDYEYIDNDYLSSASATDCTGLIPAGITEEEEIAYYEELYPFLPKAISKKAEE